MKYNLKNIANETGFSVSTVSRFLCGKRRYYNQKEKLIFKTANKYNYPYIHNFYNNGIKLKVSLILNIQKGEFFSSLLSDFHIAAKDSNCDIEIIDMKNELVSGNRDIFSNKLLQYLTESLEKGSQSILFLNRRGSFSSMQCRKCGSLATCARCNLPYTYHSQLHKLICHRCSRRRRFYGKCLKCGANEVYYGGIGTQQVIANLNRHFPEVSTIRWDSDTAKNIKEHERILEEFRSNSNFSWDANDSKGTTFPQCYIGGCRSG